MNTKHKRTKHGAPIPQKTPIAGTENARAADVIAMLSGVNAKQVLRVMAALEAVRRATGAQLGDLASIAAIPLDRVTFTEDFSDQENTARAASADALVRYVVREGFVADLEYILRTQDRFS